MSRVRQDAWTTEEDEMLQQIVLSHIQSGHTQMSAFTIAGEKLHRTAAACGFRWNAFLRKRLKEEVELAKQQRITKKENKEQDMLHHIIDQLQQLKKSELTKREEMDKKAYQKLYEENNRLRKQIQRYEDAWTEMQRLWNWIEEN